MKSTDKQCIEYALHAFDTFWDYYKKTLDERNQIINNYIAFVGIPISIVSIFSGTTKLNISKYSIYIILLFLIFFILGIIIYNSYVIESFVSEKYLKQIKHITKYLMKHYDTKCMNVFEQAYNLEQLFLNKKLSQIQRINKSFIVIITNTGIIAFISLLIFTNNTRWYCMIFSIILSLIIHFGIFHFHKKYSFNL